MPADGGREEVRAIAPAPPPVCHDACSQPSHSIAPHRLPRQNRRGSKEPVAANARSDGALRWRGMERSTPNPSRNQRKSVTHPSGSFCYLCCRFVLLAVHSLAYWRGSRDGAALAAAASRGRDVPVWVTASPEYRGCLRVVVLRRRACRRSCTPSGASRCLFAAITSIAPHRLPRQNRRGSKEPVASDARSDRPLRWLEHRAQHPSRAEPAERCHPSIRFILLPMLPVCAARCSLPCLLAGESGRRGPCDGCEQGP